MPTTRHTFVCPIYNIDVDNDVLGVDYNGYIIISASEFHENYVSQLYCDNMGLLDDIKLPQLGSIVDRPTARYIIISYIDLEDGYNQDVISANNKKIDEFFCGFCFVIMALRWLAPGNIQVNNAYVLSSRSARRRDFGISTPLYGLSNMYTEGTTLLFLNNYRITDVLLNRAIELGQKIIDNYSAIEYPAVYFNQYYQTYHLQDKLIKLMTLLETSLMGDSPIEKQYALICRGCYFLNKNIGLTLKCAYSIRSEYLHSGDIKQKTGKKIQQIVNKQNEWEALFVFITEYLEFISREVLNKLFLEILATGHKIDQIDRDLDEQIYAKLSSS